MAIPRVCAPVTSVEARTEDRDPESMGGSAGIHGILDIPGTPDVRYWLPLEALPRISWLLRHGYRSVLSAQGVLIPGPQAPAALFRVYVVRDAGRCRSPSAMLRRIRSSVPSSGPRSRRSRDASPSCVLFTEHVPKLTDSLYSLYL